MGGRAMRGTTVVGLVMLVGLGLLTSPAIASGGGGCGRAVTDRPGTHVRILNYCFGPTILRVRRGETVTWTNRDGWAHTVLGANGTWGGFDSLRRDGGEVSYRFARSGIYPYVCTYHPGMIGAIVVGNGRGRGIAGAVTTSTGPVIPETTSSTDDPIAVVETSQRPVWAPAVGWGIGLVAVFAAALIVGRRRRAPTA
jgi:plastocyanin